MRRAAKKDTNHLSIVSALEARGVHVVDLSGLGHGVADIVTTFRQRSVFMEIKSPTARVKKGQVAFLARYPGYSGIATTSDQAVAMATDPEKHCLTDQQKYRLAIYHKAMGDETVLSTLMRAIR